MFRPESRGKRWIPLAVWVRSLVAGRSCWHELVPIRPLPSESHRALCLACSWIADVPNRKVRCWSAATGPRPTVHIEHSHSKGCRAFQRDPATSPEGTKIERSESRSPIPPGSRPGVDPTRRFGGDSGGVPQRGSSSPHGGQSSQVECTQCRFKPDGLSRGQNGGAVFGRNIEVDVDRQVGLKFVVSALPLRECHSEIK